MSPSQHKILHSLIVLCIFISIVMPHMVFELLLEVFHLLFEGIESSLDTIIELVFETGGHETQIIVFYIMFALMAYGGYRLWKAMPRYWQVIRNYVSVFYNDYKTALLIYWLELSLFGKIKFVTISFAISYLVFLLSF
jgi:hypothetical protein